jgi:hypothetical protein
MERKKPIAGEFYRHFKGKLYQIKMLARDSETERIKVVYQAMYAPYDCWVRDLEEFLSRVPREKYPDAAQTYRFERISLEETTGLQTDAESVSDEEILNSCSTAKQRSVSDEELLKALKTGQPERYLEKKMTEEEIADRGLLQLLDAETFHEKKQIFIGLKQYLNERILTNIAAALDIVLEEGDVEAQYESIMRCLEAFEHYEGGRLR